MLDRLKFAIQAFKHTGAMRVLTQGRVGQYAWTERNMAAFAEEGYKKNVIAYMAVRKVATGVARIPINLFRKKTEIDEHPILRLLRSPNPLQSYVDLVEAFIAYRRISGNAYLEAVGAGDPEIDSVPNPNAPPLELWTHRPDMIRIGLGTYGPTGYIFDNGSAKKVWSRNPIDGKSAIWHSKMFNPLNAWYGMSPFEAAMYSVDQHNAASEWNFRLLKNSARPSGALTTDKTLPDNIFERLKKEIQEGMSGAKNAGKVPIFDAGLTWQAMGFSPADMDWIEGKNTSARDIANAQDVPPMLIGIPGDNTYSNQKEARESFYEDTVIPEAEQFLDGLNRWLLPMFGDGEGLRLELDLDEVPALAPKRAAKYTMISTADYLSPNEKREATGYEKLDIPEADQVYVDAGKLPMGMAAESELPGAAGAPAVGPDGKPLPAPVAGDLPASKPGATVPPVATVQETALNGAQVASLVDILSRVTSGELPEEAAVEAILLSYPFFDRLRVTAMVSSATEGEKPEPPPAPMMPGQPPGKPIKPPKDEVPDPKKDMVRELISQGMSLKSAEDLAKEAYGE